MSIKLMTRVFDKEVDATTQRVLLVLCDHANDHGHCWPSIPLIAWKLGVSERTVIRNVARLEEIGVIKVHRRTGSVNRYEIDLGVLPDKSPLVTKRHPGQNVTPDSDVTTRVTKRQGSSDTAMSPEPSRTVNEPSGGAKASKRKPELPLSDDFVLDGKVMDYAVSQGMTEDRARYQFERMKNWAEGNDIRRRNWMAQWRNWVLKDVRENGKGAGTGSWSIHKGGRANDAEIERPELFGEARRQWEKQRHEERKRQEQEDLRASS